MKLPPLIHFANVHTDLVISVVTSARFYFRSVSEVLLRMPKGHEHAESGNRADQSCFPYACEHAVEMRIWVSEHNRFIILGVSFEPLSCPHSPGFTGAL